MYLKDAIIRNVIDPLYIRVYNHMEEMNNISRLSLKLEHKKDIVNTLTEIVVIKEKYGIPYSEDLVLISKYKI